jgi:hypothetical protein
MKTAALDRVPAQPLLRLAAASAIVLFVVIAILPH